jgi:hypothetical protein
VDGHGPIKILSKISIDNCWIACSRHFDVFSVLSGVIEGSGEEMNNLCVF